MSTIISSRTPEGVPNHCPICHSEAWMEPSMTSLDAPCPCCGHLLWFDGRPAWSRSLAQAKRRPAESLLRHMASELRRPIRHVLAAVRQHLGRPPWRRRKSSKRQQSAAARLAEGASPGMWDQWLDA